MIIALVNQKGGVGKTTSVINIGAGIAGLGKRVAVVDLDPQAHLTSSLGIRAHELENTVYEVLKGEAEIQRAVIERDGLTVVPSTLDLSGAEVELSNEAGREFLLREALEALEGYDYILLDAPPSLGLLSLNALTASSHLIIPLQAEFLALQGMSKLLETIEKVKGRLNKKLDISGIIVTHYDGRKNLNREVAEKITGHFGEKVFKRFVRDNISLAEAPSFGLDIFKYRPSSHGAEDYMALSKEILERHG
jgi:chromosome partitioning protein